MEKYSDRVLITGIVGATIAISMITISDAIRSKAFWESKKDVAPIVSCTCPNEGP